MGHRVFIGLSEVAGYFGALQYGFAEIGIPSTFLDESAHPFQYRSVPRLSRFMAAFNSARRKPTEPSNPLRRVLLRVANVWLDMVEAVTRIVLFIWAAARYDVFVFGAGQTFLRRRDLRILRLLRKRVIIVFTGSDHRPPYLSGRWMARPDADVGKVLAETSRIKRVIDAAERNHCAIIGLGASAQFHRLPIYHFLDVGIPINLDAEDVDGATNWFQGSGVRILHSPSDPEGKGTNLVRQAIESLREKGLLIDYLEITGRPHREVVEALKQCDFVVDEVYSDTPMAVLATEAAWFGKPSVVTGYFASEMASETPTRRPPSLFRLPHELEDAIEGLVVDADQRVQLGLQAKAFVRENWSPAQVATRIMTIADGRAPNDWLFDPSTLRYVHGWGLSEDRLRQGLRRVISGTNLSNLELRHNPNLEHRIKELVG